MWQDLQSMSSGRKTYVRSEVAADIVFVMRCLSNVPIDHR